MKKRSMIIFVSLFAVAPAVFGANTSSSSLGEKRTRTAFSAEAKECHWMGAKSVDQSSTLSPKKVDKTADSIATR